MSETSFKIEGKVFESLSIYFLIQTARSLLAVNQLILQFKNWDPKNASKVRIVQDAILPASVLACTCRVHLRKFLKHKSTMKFAWSSIFGMYVLSSKMLWHHPLLWLSLWIVNIFTSSTRPKPPTPSVLITVRSSSRICANSFTCSFNFLKKRTIRISYIL